MGLEVAIQKQHPGFNLEIAFAAGREQLGLLGASGSGKSMTLRCIAGIDTPDAGRIVVDGQVVFDAGRQPAAQRPAVAPWHPSGPGESLAGSGTPPVAQGPATPVRRPARRINLPPQQRRVGYLFQNYALFPTMTVADNLRLVLAGTGRLPSRRPSRQELDARLAPVVAALGLAGLESRLPAQLSGGQQQRVALARLLLSNPAAILLDEPFSALDTFLRHQVEQELMASLDNFPGSIVFVSHNRDEVYRLCPRLIVLENGRMVGQGSRDELFNQPGTLAAARLTGCRNLAQAQRTGDHSVAVPAWGLVLQTATPVPPDITHLGIRAHHIREAREGEPNCFDFRVERSAQAPFTLTEFLVPLLPHGFASHAPLLGGSLQRELGGFAQTTPVPPPGTVLRLCLPPEHLLLLV